MAAAVGDAGDAPGAPRLSYAVLKKGNNSRPVKRALARRPQWSDMLDDGTNGGVTAELPALETGPAASASCGDRCAFKTDNMIWSGKVWDSNLVWKFMMSPLLLPPVDFSFNCRDPTRRQAVSHALGIARPLINKDDLVRTMTMTVAGRDDGGGKAASGASTTHGLLPLPDFMPETVLLQVKEGLAADKWRGWAEFVARHASHTADAPDGQGDVWLLKPTNSNRGRGIEIVRTPEEAAAALGGVVAEGAEGSAAAATEGKSEAVDDAAAATATTTTATAAGTSSGSTSTGTASSQRRVTTNATLKAAEPKTWVVQKYLERPLLIAGRKFDVRVWTLWRCVGKRRFEVAVFPEGYVRTSSDAYALDAKDKFVHLTNYCLQKDSDTFGAHEDGNTLSFAEYDAYMRSASAGGDEAKSDGKRGDDDDHHDDDGRDDRHVGSSNFRMEEGWRRGASEHLMNQARHIVATSAKAVHAYLTAPVAAIADGEAGGRGDGAAGKSKGARRISLKERMQARQNAVRAGRSGGDGHGDSKAADVEAAGDGKHGEARAASAADRWEDVPLGASGRQHQFELLGYDFLLDESHKAWLLEVNVNPSLHYQNEWHEALVDEMVEATFQAAVDPVFGNAEATGREADSAEGGGVRPFEVVYDSSLAPASVR